MQFNLVIMFYPNNSDFPCTKWYDFFFLTVATLYCVFVGFHMPILSKCQREFTGV